MTISSAMIVAFSLFVVCILGIAWDRARKALATRHPVTYYRTKRIGRRR